MMTEEESNALESVPENEVIAVAETIFPAEVVEEKSIQYPLLAIEEANK